jgi:DNA polymerase III subunit epsilon
MRTVLIVDVETTGLEPGDAKLVEVGAVLFDVPQRAVLSQVSTLLPVDENPVERINGIRAEMTWGVADAVLKQAKELVRTLSVHADAYVAHNAAFDSKWLPELTARPWICTMEDVRWPRAKKGHPSVMSLALDYGVPVWAAHRALTDCTYLAQVMEREPDLELLLQAAMEPRAYYISLLPYERRQECKDAGFVWDRQVPKAWSKKLSASEAAALPFPTRTVVIQ